jgi:adenosylcobyric acid synthase
LRFEPDVSVILAEPGRPLPNGADLILMPGSKSTIADLRALVDSGWDIDIKAHARLGGRVLGLCGGYQMLGRLIADPEGSEGKPGYAVGLGLLDVETRLGGDKALRAVTGIERASSMSITGYEMHIGHTEGQDCRRPMIDLDGRPDGATSPDGRVMGCYVHGLFASDAFRHAFLASLRQRTIGLLDYEAMVGTTLDDLARHLERNLDIERILEFANG